MAMNEVANKKYEEIKELIVNCCNEILNEEYKELGIKILDKLSRKHNIPFTSGFVNTWACGIIYSLGQANFLFDRASKPYIAAKDLASYFNIAKSTAGTKASELNKMFKIDCFHSEWILPSNIENNSLIWFLEINGITMDIRNCPLDLQIEAYTKGLIPYVPALTDIFGK